MPTYIGLVKLTEQGARDIKNAPARIEDATKLLQKMGGKVIAMYLVFGEYDYVFIGECPNDEVSAAFALAVGSQGNVRTTTLKAFPANEMQAILDRVPRP